MNANPFLHALVIALGLLVLHAFPWPYGLVSVALFAWVISRWVVFGFIRIKQHADWIAWRQWQGRYFEFGGIQVRIECDDDGIRIAADDVFRQLDVRPSEADRRRLALSHGDGGYVRDENRKLDIFSDTAVLAYLRTQRGRRAQRLRLWLERQVFPSLRARMERDLPL